MQLDVYRDRNLERLLIVKQGTVVKDLGALSADFLNALVLPNTVDSEVGELPTCVKRDEVLQAIEARGYFAGTYTAVLREIDL